MSGNFTVLTDIEETKLESMKQRASSWETVFDCLFSHNPNMFDEATGPSTGEQLVLAEIRRLQALDKKKKK